MILTYETEFHAAHFLPDHPGKCAGLHGHTYKLSVSIDGVVNAQTHMVMDFSEFKKMVEGCVEELDHKNLNEVLPCPPTAEAILSYIAGKMLGRLPRDKTLLGKTLSLKKIRLWETSNCSVEYIW